MSGDSRRWDEKMITRLRKPAACPKCGRPRVQLILVGRPTPEGLEMLNRGEAVMGGCLIEENMPDWKCADCGDEWYDPTDPVRQEWEATQRELTDQVIKEKTSQHPPY